MSLAGSVLRFKHLLNDAGGEALPHTRKGSTMPEYTMRTEFPSYVAMDVHSRSIVMRGIDLTTGETRSRRVAGEVGAGDAVGWAESWMTGPVYFAYESGPCGFQLCRDIRALDHSCDVIAVTSIPRSPEDKYLKDDKRDAQRLLSEMTKVDSKLKTVYVPTTRIESLRDLTRARYDAMAISRRSRQLVSSMLTRYGYVWNERTAGGKLADTWTQRYVAWVKKAELAEPVAQQTLRAYLENALEDLERLKRIEKLCRAEAEAPDVKPFVDALTRLMCVDTLTALTFYASMGDFERFERGRSVSAYYGLTPSHGNSGEKRNRNGSITKAGDSLVRVILTEAVSGSMAAAKVNTKARKKGAEVSDAAEGEARKCNARNRARYADLAVKGKHHNVVKTAVASELARDMWIIGRMVQREQAARK